MTILTKAQRKALFMIFQRDFPGWQTPTRRAEGDRIVRVPSIQWRRFRANVRPAFGGDCVMLPWHGMWLGIEKDGYTHS